MSGRDERPSYSSNTLINTTKRLLERFKTLVMTFDQNGVGLEERDVCSWFCFQPQMNVVPPIERDVYISELIEKAIHLGIVERREDRLYRCVY